MGENILIVGFKRSGIAAAKLLNSLGHKIYAYDKAGILNAPNFVEDRSGYLSAELSEPKKEDDFADTKFEKENDNVFNSELKKASDGVFNSETKKVSGDVVNSELKKENSSFDALLNGIDTAVISPSVSINSEIVKECKKRGICVIGEIEAAFSVFIGDIETEIGRTEVETDELRNENGTNSTEAENVIEEVRTEIEIETEVRRTEVETDEVRTENGTNSTEAENGTGEIRTEIETDETKTENEINGIRVKNVVEEARTENETDDIKIKDGSKIFCRCLKCQKNKKTKCEQRAGAAETEIDDCVPLSAAACGRKRKARSVVAVTGTNGKTTTTLLIDAAYRAGGINCAALGNVGTPFSDFPALNVDTAVLEVSSFQLESTKTFRPHIAIFLNFASDHLDRHKDMGEYFAAKLKIFENQTIDDYAVINYDDGYLKEYFDMKNSVSEINSFEDGSFENAEENQFFPKADGVHIRSELFYFSAETRVKGAYVEDGKVFFDDGNEIQAVCEVGDIKIPGRHNLENALAAVCAAKLEGIENEFIISAFRNFSLPHNRIEFVKRIGETDFFNDSKGTNIHASLAAIKSMKGDTALILGGSDKGEDFSELFNELPDAVRAVFVTGENAKKIIDAANDIGIKTSFDADLDTEKIREKCGIKTSLNTDFDGEKIRAFCEKKRGIDSPNDGEKSQKNRGIKTSFNIDLDTKKSQKNRGIEPRNNPILSETKTLKEAVERAYECGVKNVLFSPASASFDRYRNYEERGQVFVALVEELRQNFSGDG
jgi:UDP-N-acetylmuramoylalanine--D-glutamate ligase